MSCHRINGCLEGGKLGHGLLIVALNVLFRGLCKYVAFIVTLELYCENNARIIEEWSSQLHASLAAVASHNHASTNSHSTPPTTHALNRFTAMPGSSHVRKIRSARINSLATPCLASIGTRQPSSYHHNHQTHQHRNAPSENGIPGPGMRTK